MFLDRAHIEIQAGPGGNGCRSFRREAHVPRGGPDGGSGGNGGSVIVRATHERNTLIDYRYQQHYRAEKGGHGKGKDQHGRQGEDIIMYVPLGTIIKLQQEDGSYQPVADLIEEGEEITLARGGKGGLGNAQLATPQYQAPNFAQLGEPTEPLMVELELKLIADVGLIGLPNAGKSTLLSVISNAKPKIADYPFTTLVPNLGVVKHREEDFVVADIPGLIEGAHQGRGLGDEFLRHVERTRVLLHVVDGQEGFGELAAQSLRQIQEEMIAYDDRLKDTPQLIVVNKIDLLSDEDQAFLKQEPTLLETAQKLSGRDPFFISAAAQQGLAPLLDQLVSLLKSIPKVQDARQAEVIYRPLEQDERRFTVEREGRTFYLSGKRVKRIALTTDFQNPEAVQWMHDRLDAMGVIKELNKLGIRPGDKVVVDSVEFDWV